MMVFFTVFSFFSWSSTFNWFLFNFTHLFLFVNVVHFHLPFHLNFLKVFHYWIARLLFFNVCVSFCFPYCNYFSFSVPFLCDPFLIILFCFVIFFFFYSFLQLSFWNSFLFSWFFFFLFCSFPHFLSSICCLIASLLYPPDGAPFLALRPKGGKTRS